MIMFFYLSSQVCYCGGLLSNVEPCVVRPSPWTLSYHKCNQCIHIGNICLCYMVCVSWEFSVLKLTFLWRRQWPHLLPDIWKNCKILKILCLEFQIGFVFSTVCQNFHPTCQLQPYCLWSVKTEGCVNPFCSSCEWRCVMLVHWCPAVCQLVL